MVARDEDGYLVDLTDWTPAIAESLAAEQGITLTEAHWELIELIQSFYQRYEHSPSNRPLAKWIRDHLGPTKAATLYLMGLFPVSPPKQLALIVGLPRPEHCL